ncbi:non-reducing end alpha-L-arabinofuranosidase family hydrolase [Streptomyces lincolnensis]|uniref:non-reducing end alpha-L-arabinofuranosidase family hydrolase n=1 Tax=Streptomyces lincolnensis TaxID=1915 RepID=UPI0009A11482|nr:non-reducing end alpha-L-arabinofuranosidase family hydrolase [Streptomyces lincolnensis]
MQKAANPSWRRCFRSFTSTSLTGPWTPTSGVYDNPFAGRNNVTYPADTGIRFKPTVTPLARWARGVTVAIR